MPVHGGANVNGNLSPCVQTHWANTVYCVLVFLSMLTGPPPHAPAAPPEAPWFPRAPALPAPEGPVVRVQDVEQLLGALAGAEPGTTILVADGHYLLPRYAEITADCVTLRSESGNRHAVVLDGAKSRHIELLGIRNAGGVTIADLTVRNVVANGIKINSNTPVHGVTVRNCVVHNVWQRGVKSVRSPELKTRGGVIEYCLFYNDRPKRFDDDPHDTPENFGGNYVGAIDRLGYRGQAETLHFTGEHHPIGAGSRVFTMHRSHRSRRSRPLTSPDRPSVGREVPVSHGRSGTRGPEVRGSANGPPRP